MDTQTTWDRLLVAYENGDWDTIEACATELLEWLDGGGLPPPVLGYRLPAGLGTDFHRALVAGVRNPRKARLGGPGLVRVRVPGKQSRRQAHVSRRSAVVSSAWSKSPSTSDAGTSGRMRTP